MRLFRDKWELALIPIVLIVVIIMIGLLEGCKEKKTASVPQIEKGTYKSNGKLNPQNFEEKNNNTKAIKPNLHDKTGNTKQNDEKTSQDTENRSNFTGEVPVCLSNNTYGWVLPCG